MNSTLGSGGPHRMVIPADLSRLAEVREWLGTIALSAGLSPGRAFDLQVVSSEAVANGVEHAKSTVEIEAWLLADRLLVEISNDGDFQPGLNKDDDNRRRGLGLPLMVSLADQVHVSRLSGARTKVCLTFFRDDRSLDPASTAPRSAAARTGRGDWVPTSDAPAARWRWLRPLSLLPIPLLVIVVAVLYGSGAEGARESASLLTAFNTLFVAAAMLIVSYLAARTYLVGGSAAQLTLGTGSFLLGGAVVLAGPLISEPNVSLTVHNTTFMVTGLLFAATGLLSLYDRGRERVPRPRWLALGYGLSVGFLAAWSLLAAGGRLPSFFVPGTGYTVTRTVITSAGVAAFLAAAACLIALYRRRPSPFVLFAAASFGMQAVAMGSLLVTEAALGSPINWAARGGTWVGGLYLLAAAMSVEYGGAWLLPLQRSLRESEARYRSLVDLSPDAVLIHAGGRYLAANPAAARLLGWASPADVVGRDVDEVLHPDTRDVQRQRIDEVYSGAMSPSAEEKYVRTDGTSLDVSVFRTRIEYKGRLAVQSVARDITERKRAEEAHADFDERGTTVEQPGPARGAALSRGQEHRTEADLEALSRLHELSQRLLDPEGEELMLQHVMDTSLVLMSADKGMLQLFEGDSLRVVAQSGHDERFLEFCASAESQVSACGRALARGERVIVDDVEKPCFFSGTPSLILLRAADVRAVQSTPITDRAGQALGVLTTHWARPHCPSEQELWRLDLLARQAGDMLDNMRSQRALRASEERYRSLAAENERLYRQQLEIAESLQLALLSTPSQLGRVQIGHLYRSATETARVGGDFYDAFETKNGTVAVLVGDVSGHGIEAARTATLVKDVIHAFAHQTTRPHEVLSRTNGLLLEKLSSGFVTLFLGILDAATGRLRYASAGHPETLLRRDSGEVQRLGCGSTPLGVYPDASWRSHAIDLAAGDILLLYTDGVTDARHNGEFFGEKRLEKVLRRRHLTPEKLPHMVLERVLAFSGGKLADDVAVLAMLLTDSSSKPTDQPGQERLMV